jgi:sigma-B regulation protein RsbU (phosphoserine phosphatase)
MMVRVDARRLQLMAAVVFLGAAAFYSAVWFSYIDNVAEATLGIEVDFNPATWDLIIASVDPGTPAERAGLRVGDRIVAVNGRRTDTPNPFADAVTRGRPGDVVTFGIVRNDTGPSVVQAALAARPPAPRPPPARRFVLSVLRYYPLGFLVVAAVTVLQRPGDRAVWLLALICVSLIASAPFDEGLFHPTLRRLAVSFKLLSTFLPAALFGFFAIFPVRSPIDRRVPWLKTVLLAVALGAVLILLPWVASSASLAPLEWLTLQPFWPIIVVAWTAYTVTGVGLGLTSLVWNNRRAPREARRRIRVIVWGMVFGLTPVFVFDPIAGAAGLDPDVRFWIWAPSVLALFLIPMSFAYAVVKYRVLDIPVLLQRSARYLLVQRGFVVLLFIAGIAITVALAFKVPEMLPARPETAASAGLMAGAGFGVLLAWGGSRLHRRMSGRIDRAFFRTAYDARRILEDLATCAGRAASREELGAVLERSIREALQPVTISVYLETIASRLRRFGGAAASTEERLTTDRPEVAAIATHGRPVVASGSVGRSMLGVFAAGGAECVSPIFCRDGRLAGLIVLGMRRSEVPYANEDLRLLASVCTQAGFALDSISMAERIAERLQAERRAARELEIAKEVQSKLLPQQEPMLRTLACAAVCQQARAVGGDYYDFLDLGGGRFAFVLADISGKGISAALLMANLQAYVRSNCALARQDLPGLLASLQRHLLQTTPSSRFATMFFACYDEEPRRLVYANCGHPPPLLLRANGAVDWLTSTAGVLGLFDHWVCQCGERQIDMDDTLVIYTDGVIEAMDDEGEYFEQDRLVEIVRAHCGSPAPRLLDAVVTAVNTFSGTVQEDDLTLVVLRGI